MLAVGRPALLRSEDLDGTRRDGRKIQQLLLREMLLARERNEV